MNIPDIAMDAALQAVSKGVEFHMDDRMYWEQAAKDMLEAAAPFIAAQALRDLANVMHREGGHFETVDPKNPRAIEWTAAIQSYFKRARVLAEDMEDEQ